MGTNSLLPASLVENYMTRVNANVIDCSLAAHYSKSISLGAGLVASKPVSDARESHDWTATSQ